jgi:Ca2+-binding RTX toxin-like protein
VRSTVSYALGVGLERLVLLGRENLSGIGNGLINALIGNRGSNSLTGGGGLDVLRGGRGNDTFTVDAQGEAVELAGQGIDTVRSAVSYSLGANIEKLVLLGTEALSGIGNGLANTLTGNGAGNILVGGGGVDLLRGGPGNDIYSVDGQGEAIELAGQGIDTVRSTVSYRLDGNLENLTLFGSDNLQGIGNARANILIGNSGANSLTGGAGRDTLHGGQGNDAFVFNAALSGAPNVDVVRDMNERGNDTILLDNAVFTALGPAGVLGPGAFRVNATGLAVDKSDRIIFEFDTGEIYYDSNGSTAGGTYVLFARVDPNISLTAADFAVF